MVCEFRTTTMPEGPAGTVAVDAEWTGQSVCDRLGGACALSGVTCAWLGAGFPSLSNLRNSYVSQGSVWSEQRETSWDTELTGQFRQIDLEQCVTRQFRHLSSVAWRS